MAIRRRGSSGRTARNPQQGRRTKGQVGKVRVKRGPRKGTVVNAYIYSNGKWAEIKSGGGRGRMHSAKSGRARIKPKYSAASMRARIARKRLGLTLGSSHRRNVRRNNTLRRFAPRAAVPHTRTRRSLASAGTRRPRHLRNTRPPSKHRGSMSSGSTTRRGKR